MNTRIEFNVELFSLLVKDSVWQGCNCCQIFDVFLSICV